MSPQEPHAFGELFQLRVDVADEGDQRARAAVGSNERPSIWAPQRILGMVTDGSSEESAMHVQEI